ncbi:uncharacterized protein EI97DRAFT_430302 [Westerdykella ornata]|uniref:N-acetyltransferase domain-containing protein n=1 Tax=Westerdykella ornata TaxID=318751 RepID=A0A6A6JVX4_WESOR|nr:uncharacterized protein EI97DRAFT_430302 [Westerdykella ornata]KAF2279209.1 hypothetical protein EI97DRAFT_430302 [Westerdykella ornata]
METTPAPLAPLTTEQPSTSAPAPETQKNANPQPTSNPNNVKINITTSSTGSDYATPAATLFASAYSTDPVFAYLLNNLGPKKQSRARAKLFGLLCMLFAMDGLEFWEASISSPSDPNRNEEGGEDGKPHFHAALVLATPGPKTSWSVSASTIFNLLFRSALLPFIFLIGPRQFGVMNGEYASLCEPVRKAYLAKTLGTGEGKEDEYFEVKLVATDEAYRGRGLCPALMRKVQERAAREGKPVWLEASNANARRQYLKLGFKEVREEGPLKLGQGKCGEDGQKKKKGEEGATGVSVWPMVWWPEGSK